SPVAPHWTGNPPAFYTINGAAGAEGAAFPWGYNATQIADFGKAGQPSFAWNDGTDDGQGVGCTLPAPYNVPPFCGNGKTFHIITSAQDLAGNVETAYTTMTFIFDNVPAYSSPTFPVNGQA